MPGTEEAPIILELKYLESALPPVMPPLVI